MLLKYFGSLAVAVFFATYAICFMPFVSQAAVIAGTIQQEHLKFGLAFKAGSTYYTVDAGQAQFLSEHMGLLAVGSAHVVAANVNVTPATVSVISAKGYRSVPGATMTADLTWDTPADSSERAEGRISLDFPEVPGLEGAKPLLSYGEHTVDRAGHVVIREETAYREPLQLSLGRIFLALSLGLPMAMLLHAVGWYLLVLRRERQSRIAALPKQGPTGILPRSFFPDPIAEWRTGLLVLAVFAFLATLFAYGSTGVVNCAYTEFAYILVAASIPVAAAVADYTGATVLNLRVELRGISIASGRKRLRWQVIPWDNVTEFREKARRRRSWVELTFKGQWKKLRITDRTILDYTNLCNCVKQCWRRSQAPRGPGRQTVQPRRRPDTRG